MHLWWKKFTSNDAKLVKGCINNRSFSWWDKKEDNDVYIPRHLYLILKVQVLVQQGKIRKDPTVKGRRPRIVWTIDRASLPQGICDPTSALQTFRSRRDDAISLKRPRRVGRPPSNPSEPYEVSLHPAAARHTQLVIFARTRELASTCNAWRDYHYSPRLPFRHRHFQRDRSSRWELDLDLFFPNFAAVRECLILRNGKTPRTS